MAAKRAVSAAADARENERMPKDKNGILEVPQGLVDSIANGTCIAFVGAGFSGAARLPGWASLLEKILERGVSEGKIPAKKKDQIQLLINQGTSDSFDTAAQMMEDCEAPVAEVARELLTSWDQDSLPQAMKDRLRFMYGIPFNAIVTTNFDNFLSGVPAAHEDAKPVMRKILRSPPLSMIDQLIREIANTMKNQVGGGKLEEFGEFMSGLEEAMKESVEDVGDEGEVADEEIEVKNGASADYEIPIIQLHGTVAENNDNMNADYLQNPGLAFTRLGYRRLLHGNASYQGFLGALMATKTILYLGFSFSDAYINEMRSQTMMMLQQSGLMEEEQQRLNEEPIAYAIMLNQDEAKIDFYQKHEGVKILNYTAPDGPGFEGIENWLKAIYLKTNPLYRWSRCVEGKRFCVCAKGGGAMTVLAVLKFVETEFGVSAGEIVTIPIPDEGEEASQEQFNNALAEHDAFDIVCVAWKTNGHPTAKLVLGAMDTLPTEKKSPVLVLESVKDEEDTDIKIRSLMLQRRSAAFRLGAAGYACNINGIFTQVQNILKRPVAVNDECSIL